jgi:hypothetical protein
VLSGVEGVSGKNQLKTVFDFLSKTNHANKVIFVWSCDVNYSLEPLNNTYPFILPRNESNKIATNGIENISPESLFDNYKKTISLSSGEVIIEFDESGKRDFESKLLDRNNVHDFYAFSSLIKEIERITNR